MSAHTSGSWHVELGAYIYGPRYKIADAGFAPTEAERTANAYVMAAASELLKALYNYVYDDDIGARIESSKYVAARAAIAKAEGRG